MVAYGAVATTVTATAPATTSKARTALVAVAALLVVAWISDGARNSHGWESTSIWVEKFQQRNGVFTMTDAEKSTVEGTPERDAANWAAWQANPSSATDAEAAREATDISFPDAGKDESSTHVSGSEAAALRNDEHYRNWDKNQPDNFGGEDCVHMKKAGINRIKYPLKWNDANCNRLSYAICEKGDY